MAKKKSGKAAYTSKGSVGVNKYIRRQGRAERAEVTKYANKMDAFRKGKNVVFTIPNPNPNETNRLFIRVTGKELLGDWREKS